jgi:hypothetical protein
MLGIKNSIPRRPAQLREDRRARLPMKLAAGLWGHQKQFVSRDSVGCRTSATDLL